jgi:hypothetical protein
MVIGPKEEIDIIKAVHSLGIKGNDEGIIETFGVLLTNMYADYYNTLSYEAEREVMNKMGEQMEQITSRLLIHAAQDCCINTLGGIWASPEWTAVVKPHVETKEDVIKGMVAVTNALGWGNWKVIEIVPFKKLVLEAYSPYEALGYVEKYGATAKRGKCYMLAGVAGGFLDLVYPPGTEDKSIDEVRPIAGKTNLSERLEKYLCADEELCIAKGDDHCRFIAVPYE